jgi:SNF2 family DNA or RNA helicase
VPDHPFLISAPGTIVTQWINEAKRFLVPGSVDIFHYPDGAKNHRQFWSEDGLWKQSKQALGRRVIFTSHAVRYAASCILT